MARDPERDRAIAAAFGQRVREVRLEKEMTQEQLAEAAGLHPTFVSNVERGYRVPSIATLFRMADGLAVPAQQLIADIDRRPKPN